MGRSEWVECADERELANVLHFLWKGDREGELVSHYHDEFTVVAQLDWKLGDFGVGNVTIPEIRKYLVKVPRRLLVNKGISDAIESLKSGGAQT